MAGSSAWKYFSDVNLRKADIEMRAQILLIEGKERSGANV
jgi:hypothetical protein